MNHFQFGCFNLHKGSRDLGVPIDDRLGYSSNLDDIVQQASIIVSWILRAFCVGSPSAYMKLFESHDIPILVFASPIWHSSSRGYIDKLRKLHRRFLERVEFRCGLAPRSLDTVDMVDRLEKADIRAIRRMIRSDVTFDEFFVLRSTSSRREVSLAPHTRAAADIMAHQFAGRMTNVINSQ